MALNDALGSYSLTNICGLPVSMMVFIQKNPAG